MEADLNNALIGLTISAIVLGACAETSGSAGFVARGGVRVTPVNADVFEVAARPGEGEYDFWCGAGEYARRQLGASDSTRVYVVGGVGRGTVSQAPETAQFSLKRPGQAVGASERQARWGPRVGQSSTVASARRKCNVDRNDFWA